MARTRTLVEMIAVVRSRTNMENSTFVTDAEITEFLNEEWSELVGRIVMGEGQAHFISLNTINVVSGTSLYALPADFWRLLRMTATIDGRVRDMTPFMEGERADLANTQVYTSSLSSGPMYRVQGDNIEILPATRTFTCGLRYIRSTPMLVAAADTVDGFNGYEQAMVAGACALVRAKEESDTSFFDRRKDRIYRQIDALAAQRDVSHPERVTDVTGDLYIGTERLP